MRIATWNVNSIGARLPRLNEWLELAEPDVLCLQETKIADDGFPGEQAENLGDSLLARFGVGEPAIPLRHLRPSCRELPLQLRDFLLVVAGLYLAAFLTRPGAKQELLGEPGA